jgi:hypothetical protein
MSNKKTNIRIPIKDVPKLGLVPNDWSIYNTVRDYNITQGVTHPSDLTTQIIRDYNIRYITVQNSSEHTPVGIAVTNSFYMDPVPPIKFSLAPGEVRHLGVNTIGEQMQYIHILNLRNGKYLGDPSPLVSNANDFVLREGINKWFIQTFRHGSFCASK